MNSSREDYLQAVFRLSKEKGYATNKEIAEYLGVSKASVSEMVKKLEASGKFTIENKHIRLSDNGDKLAKAVLSKHRIWLRTALLLHFCLFGLSDVLYLIRLSFNYFFTQTLVIKQDCKTTKCCIIIKNIFQKNCLYPV